MANMIVFEILIPCTDNSSGLVHPQEKFDDWIITTTEKFGGITVLNIHILGLWYDNELKPEANPVEDHNNWYKIAVPPTKVDELRLFLKETAGIFGQKCIYFERAGEVEFIESV